MKLVIRTGGVYEDEMFRERTRDVSPSMAKSGSVSFETLPSVNGYWDWCLVLLLSCISTSR